MKKCGLIVLLIAAITPGFLQCQINHQLRITLDPQMQPFYHGVESGDPMEDRVILWTRVTPDSGVAGPIDVYWQVATDTDFTNIVNYGKAIATAENHFCVKADVCGLSPSTYYYYLFNAQGRNSIMGRTKTAPAPGADVDSLRFAVVSCASWEHGYFNAYEAVTNHNDVDAVIHLGDYIYEYESGGYGSSINGRTYDPPTECITELGYELRYSQYKLDKQLQRIHQLFPFITVWDDHETANDSWREGAENHTPGVEGNFIDRKHNSTSTYFKWMPIRKPDPADTIRIFRKLRYGKLMDLIMLDTRLYDRDEQDLGARDDTGRHIMGPVERAWFLQQLSDTTTRWKIIGNQVMFAPLQVAGLPVNADQWDGYNYERTLIENHILNNNIKDVVVLTGDIHTSWCNDVPGPNYNDQTGAGSVCVEFVGTSITSSSSPLPVGSGIIQAFNPHVKYVNTSAKGFYTLSVLKNKTQADYTYVSTITQLGATESWGPCYYVNNNERFLRQTGPILNAPVVAAALPPLNAKQGIAVRKITDHYVTIPQRTQASVNIIPSVQICPAVNLNIIQGRHGVAISFDGQNAGYVPAENYYGYDTVGFAICTADSVPSCDTVYLFITITQQRDIDTVTVNINDTGTYTGCLHFNDLMYSVSSVQLSQPANGGVLLFDSCFTYTPDSAYRGVVWVTFTGCDTAGNCDTIVYQVRINHPVTPSTVQVTLNKNTNATFCPYFDDLLCMPAAINITGVPQHGTYQAAGDTCIKYFPYFNYLGPDTMRFTACDTCALHDCDTVTVIFNTVQPSEVDHVQNELAVLGMYPNPVNDKLVIQYYLFKPGSIEFNVYDMAGRLVSTDSYYHTDYGLQYAQLNTLPLPAGTFIVELKTEGTTYRQQVLKQ